MKRRDRGFTESRIERLNGATDAESWDDRRGGARSSTVLDQVGGSIGYVGEKQPLVHEYRE